MFQKIRDSEMGSPESPEPANTNDVTAIPQDSPVSRMCNFSPLPQLRTPSAPSLEGLNFRPPVLEAQKPDPSRNTEAALNETVQNKLQNDPEALKHGALRRRLPFGDAEHEVIQLIPIQPARNPSDIEKQCPENGGGSQESNMPSPKIRWTKSLDCSEGNSCTVRNCAKTCLLWCVNAPEFEEIVRQMERKKGPKDPLEFAPKVVQDTPKQPASSPKDVRTRFTPASARHKKGRACKCRLFKCIKKLCKCFKVNVGCSDKCSCVACENSFGQRRDSYVSQPNSTNSFHQESHRYNTSASTSLSSGTQRKDNSKAHSLISAITRMAQIGGTKILQDLKFDVEISNTVKDDRPEILKGTSAPLNAVNISFPKKKRTSHPPARYQFGSSSSAGRPPRFPDSPCPPYATHTRSETVVDEEASDPQKQSDNKREKNL